MKKDKEAWKKEHQEEYKRIKTINKVIKFLEDILDTDIDEEVG